MKSFEATGIWLMDPEPILKRFNHKDQHEGEASAQPSALKKGD